MLASPRTGGTQAKSQITSGQDPSHRNKRHDHPDTDAQGKRSRGGETRYRGRQAVAYPDGQRVDGDE